MIMCFKTNKQYSKNHLHFILSPTVVHVFCLFGTACILIVTKIQQPRSSHVRSLGIVFFFWEGIEEEHLCQIKAGCYKFFFLLICFVKKRFVDMGQFKRPIAYLEV